MSAIVSFRLQPGLPAEPQTWWPLGQSAYIVCPNGHGGSITDHRIYYDARRKAGVVTPSVICQGDCGFHATIELLDWPPNA